MTTKFVKLRSQQHGQVVYTNNTQ